VDTAKRPTALDSIINLCDISKRSWKEASYSHPAFRFFSTSLTQVGPLKDKRPASYAQRRGWHPGYRKPAERPALMRQVRIPTGNTRPGSASSVLRCERQSPGLRRSLATPAFIGHHGLPTHRCLILRERPEPRLLRPSEAVLRNLETGGTLRFRLQTKNAGVKTNQCALR
jgi:hypothetical protein